ncbi:hypothetical protein Tco_1225607, partial [Tanacetum coccineum]
MRPQFLNDCARTDFTNCVEVRQTLKTHTRSVAPKGTSSDVHGTSSSCGKRKPQPQLDSFGFQMQRVAWLWNRSSKISKISCYVPTTFDMSALQHVTLENLKSLEIVP